MERRVEHDGIVKLLSAVAQGRRIDGKGRKERSPQGSSWADILNASLDGDDIGLFIEEIRENQAIRLNGEDGGAVDDVVWNAVQAGMADIPEDASRETVESMCRDILKKISRMIADDPIALLASHSGGPTMDPTPGTWVNSTG